VVGDGGGSLNLNTLFETFETTTSFVGNHSMNIHTMFGFNLSNSFRGED